MGHPEEIQTSVPGYSSRFTQLARSGAHNLHWVVTALLIVGLIPAFRVAGVPLRIGWIFFLVSYWIGLASRSIFAATLLYLLISPMRKNLRSLYQHWRAQPVRLVFLALFAVILVRELGWGTGLMFVADLIVVAEFFDRIEGDPDKLVRAGKSFVIPAAYLFVGVVVMFCYNDLIVSVRYYGSYDATFNKLDSILLHGLTVSSLVHRALIKFSLGVFEFLEIIYYGTFSQMGATFIFTGLCFGKRRAMEFAGTLLTAYYLSMVIFFVWPSIGPFAFCPTHFSEFPRALVTRDFQKLILEKAQALWAHKPILPITSDFFIAFPSMHIAQPMIVLWFLRKWKRIVAVLIVYDVVLLAAIILLEWHYIVDLLGGALVAVVAIAMVHSGAREVQ